MENNAPRSWPVDGPPAPLSTDIDEIAWYMRFADALAVSRDRKPSFVECST